jgi:type I restriction enzyme M protein
MGLVLPEGILNNPSLDWLRRWTEGKARLLAVVSLPARDLRRSQSHCQGVVALLQRFTAQDENDGKPRGIKRTRRLTPVSTRSARKLMPTTIRASPAYGRADLLPALASLAELGVTYDGARWIEPDDLAPLPPTRAPAQAADRAGHHPRRPGATQGTPERLTSRLKEMDAAQDAAVWTRVRELFDYPVFFAEPEAVGITSTGADGPNDLPEVVNQYRQFAAWVEAGAQPEATPNFQ